MNSIQHSANQKESLQHDAPMSEFVNRNLNDRFAEVCKEEQLRNFTSEGTKSILDHNPCRIQPTLQSDENSADLVPPSLDVASSVSESSRSRVTDNGHATTKLECPLRDVGETPHAPRARSTLGDDGKIYHITFYSSKIGLQFQKVPVEMSSSGLLTDAVTADHGQSVEINQTAAELRRIATISWQSQQRNRQSGPAMECLPVTPVDAVLVCGFVGFDDSNGNIRPRIGGTM